MHGIGTYTTADGESFSCRFEHGELVDCGSDCADDAAALNAQDDISTLSSCADADASGTPASNANSLYEQQLLQDQEQCQIHHFDSGQSADASSSSSLSSSLHINIVTSAVGVPADTTYTDQTPAPISSHGISSTTYKYAGTTGL
jgi:hypothetical protein